MGSSRSWSLSGHREMVLLRNGTLDAAIWGSVWFDYPTLPQSFAPGEVLLDVGCHTGALCHLGAQRGATVFGYEANRDNHALAAINLAGRPSVVVRHAAVWRSDVAAPELLFTPSEDTANTGGGSVLFASEPDHWSASPFRRPEDRSAPPPPDRVLAAHPVKAVGLDDILGEVGPVRFLKIDVEGAEFPILLTASRMDLVAAIAGEYHEFTAAQMTALAPGARVGHERYTADLLRRRLTAAGFVVTVAPESGGTGLFSAHRHY